MSDAPTPDQKRAQAVMAKICEQAQKTMSAEMPRNAVGITLVIVAADDRSAGHYVSNVAAEAREMVMNIRGWCDDYVARLDEAEAGKVPTEPAPAAPQ
jgi:hypothetical protein